MFITCGKLRTDTGHAAGVRAVRSNRVVMSGQTTRDAGDCVSIQYSCRKRDPRAVGWCQSDSAQRCVGAMHSLLSDFRPSGLAPEARHVDSSAAQRHPTTASADAVAWTG